MRKLKTPEEIVQEVTSNAHPLEDLTEKIIKSAQRDALECAIGDIDRMVKEVRQNHNTHTEDKQAYIIAIENVKSSIINLLPKI